MELKYESRIEGEFEGWLGESVYELINGQKWKQKKYKYKYKYKYRPKVKIYRVSSGYEMEVEGLDFLMPVVRVD